MSPKIQDSTTSAKFLGFIWADKGWMSHGQSRIGSNSSYCQPLCIEVHPTFITPVQILVATDASHQPCYFEWLFLKGHHIFTNETGYFINLTRSPLLCRGIINLLSCLLKSLDHWWGQERVRGFQGPKFQSLPLYIMRLRISGCMLGSSGMDRSFQIFLSSDLVQIYHISIYPDAMMP